MGDRGTELQRGLEAVRRRIEQACARSDREPSDVTVVVVTKTWPAADVRLLHELGVRDVGENRQQELADKVSELGDLDLRWHFVGQIQSKKAPRIASGAAVVHSVDSERVVQRLDVGAQRAGHDLDCLVQVRLDTDQGAARRGGVSVDRLSSVVEELEASQACRLRGLMAVAPLGADPGPAYARLADLAARLRAEYPRATWLSAGMSNDLEEAVEAGATHVRVGSAILGQRAPLG